MFVSSRPEKNHISLHYIEIAINFLIVAFIFSGLYKGLIDIRPADLTVITMLFAFIMILFFDYRFVLRTLKSVPVVLFLCICVYLLFRIDRLSFSDFGFYKISTSLIFGISSFIFGSFISSNYDRTINFFMIIYVFSIIFALLAFSKAVLGGNFTSTNPVLSGGYQLTGAFVAFGVMFSAYMLTIRRRALDVAISGFLLASLTVIGNIPAFVFGSLIFIGLGVLYSISGVSKNVLYRTLSAALLSLTIVMVLTATFKPPAAVNRLAWKTEIALEEIGVDSNIVGWLNDIDILSIDSGHVDFLGGWAKRFGFTPLPNEERERYVDRVEIFSSTISGITQRPIFGFGFGEFSHKGIRTEHNIILELWYEAGLIAVLTFILFLVSAVYRCGYFLTHFNRPNSALYALIFGVFVFAILWQMVGGFFIGRILMLTLGLTFGVEVANLPVRRNNQLSL